MLFSSYPHLVEGGHQDAQGGERHPEDVEFHVVVGVEEDAQRDGDQGELDTEREGLSVSQALDDHDDRRGHGLSQLVGADGVALEGEVGEDDEAAEAEGQRQHLGGLEALGGEGAESLAQVKAEPGDGEVDQGEAEVGETQPHVQPLV